MDGSVSMFKRLVSKEKKFVLVFNRDPEQGNNFMEFSPVLGQFDKEFTIGITCSFPLDGFPGYFKGMGLPGQ